MQEEKLKELTKETMVILLDLNIHERCTVVCGLITMILLQVPREEWDGLIKLMNHCVISSAEEGLKQLDNLKKELFDYLKDEMGDQLPSG